MATLTKFNEQAVSDFVDEIRQRNPHEPEFHQAVKEWAESVIPFLQDHKDYHNGALLHRLTEPDRTVSFRVTWMDDNEHVHVNKGYRVQFNNAIGPYKGGLRFHPTVNLSILKFLGFEQVFKNSLTTLPMGGGKGGSDFDPKGKTDSEIMRFCQAFMLELFRHIGSHTDVPAGDIGVGSQEVGYMFGMYKKLINGHTGVITGKSLPIGGSKLRPEATGYGVVYFAEEMLKVKSDGLKGKKCIISGSGNVAQYAAEKILDLGGTVHALSDSNGTIYDKEGLDEEKLAYIMDLKNHRKGRISEYADKYGALYLNGKTPWTLSCDLAFPCATQNELDQEDAKCLLANGCKGVVEGANMPCTSGAVEAFKEAGILYAPGKASNAGGVATSGLEMSQNSLGMFWERNEVDDRLREIMRNIHNTCVKYGREKDYIDYQKGANIGGFVKVADAVLMQGVI